MKIYKTNIGDIYIEIKCSDSDWKWIQPLFSRNKDPFLVLKNIGYIPSK